MRLTINEPLRSCCGLPSRQCTCHHADFDPTDTLPVLNLLDDEESTDEENGTGGGQYYGDECLPVIGLFD